MPLLSPAGKMIGAIPFPTEGVSDRVFILCMELRGWRLRAKGS